MNPRAGALLLVGCIAAGCSEAAVRGPDEDVATSITASASDTTTTGSGTSDPATGDAVSTTDAIDDGATTTTDEPEGAPADLAVADLPTSATELATELSLAEIAVRDPDEPDRPAWGRYQQALYRHLASNDDWADDVLANVDPDVADAVANNWEARQQLSSLVLSGDLATELPAWRINEPPGPQTLLAYYDEAEGATGVPWSILAAINLVETRMGRIEGLSTAGAMGPMQFLPSTWEECCEGDPWDPRDAIMGAAVYLNQRGAQTDLDRALRGYNNSDYYVIAVRAYATVLDQNREAYWGYHAWQVYFRSASGLLILPEGYNEPEPIAVDEYLAANPSALVG